MDAHFRSFRHQVVPRLVKQEIGVLGMKAMGDRIILDSGAVSAVECLHYAMSLPTSVVITGIERMEILDQAIEAARTFRPMTDREMTALLVRPADNTSSSRPARASTARRATRRGSVERRHGPAAAGAVHVAQSAANPTAQRVRFMRDASCCGRMVVSPVAEDGSLAEPAARRVKS